MSRSKELWMMEEEKAWEDLMVTGDEEAFTITMKGLGFDIGEIVDMLGTVKDDLSTIEKAADEIPNLLESNRKYHRTTRPPRR